MDKGNKYQAFSQVDYCIRQYFSKYMASTIVQEKRKLKDGQTMDDMMAQCKKRWNKDGKLSHDTQIFVNAFYRNLVAQNGGKQSKQLLAYARAYVNSRYESLTVEQLAREKVPKNSAEYIAKKAFSESLIGFGVDMASKKDVIGDKVKEKAEELYNPSAWEVGAGYVGSATIDTALTGGVGGAVTAATKGVAVAGAKIAAKATAKNMTKAVATDLAFRGGIYGVGKGLDAIIDEGNYGEVVFGDKDAITKIQDGGLKYRKGGTEYINTINGNLNKKIKTPSLSTSSIIKKESNALLMAHKGDSSKLLNSIKGHFDKQCVHYNANSKIPAWMFSNSAKQNRALASSFYACAMEMSRNQQHERKFGGKKMTVNEVAQRAYDYARAAVAVDKYHAQLNKRTGFSAETQKALDDWDKNMAMINAANASTAVTRHNKPSSAQRASTTVSSPATPPSYMQGSNPYIQQQQTQQSSTGTAVPQQTAGWGNALEQMGLSGFSDVSKNMGYVLAMLPDMLIGMFTGKNPDMKFENNLMPMAAIVAGMFVKNPLLKLLLMGFGGANLLNNAGHAALNQGYAKANKAVTYKTYSDEPLNKRITNPVMKGSSMVANIDGKPMVITISDNAVDAYERGNVPLNTLANAVLRKYDENNALASRNYELQHQEETVEQQRGLK